MSLLSDNGVRITINGVVVSDTRDLIEHNAAISEPILVNLPANKMSTMKIEWVGNMHNDKIQILDWDDKMVLDEMYIFPCHVDV
jgi:hypothetical protein